MAEQKTLPTEQSVSGFIAAVEHPTRRRDAETLLALFRRVSGWEPRLWGPTIIGFGSYRYAYESGHTGSSCVIGFSPRKANLVLYLFDFDGKETLLERLGKHRGGLRQCLYINKLGDVDLDVLEEIVRGALAAAVGQWPVSPT
jgi:hypothetical protein